MKIKNLFFIILAVMIISPVLADEGKVISISGTVVDTDWAKSIIAVNYSDPFTGNSDEVNLQATSDSVITRGIENISFSDIEQGDPVTVTYYDSGFTGLRIKRLSDLNNAYN